MTVAAALDCFFHPPPPTSTLHCPGLASALPPSPRSWDQNAVHPGQHPGPCPRLPSVTLACTPAYALIFTLPSPSLACTPAYALAFTLPSPSPACTLAYALAFTLPSPP